MEVWSRSKYRANSIHNWVVHTCSAYLLLVNVGMNYKIKSETFTQECLAPETNRNHKPSLFLTPCLRIYPSYTNVRKAV